MRHATESDLTKKDAMSEKMTKKGAKVDVLSQPKIIALFGQVCLLRSPVVPLLRFADQLFFVGSFLFPLPPQVLPCHGIQHAHGSVLVQFHASQNLQL